jgi:hypothetical protein
MNTFFYSTLLLLTIIAAFAFGVASGYWVICAFLNLFDPAGTQKEATATAALVSSASGD